MNRPLTIVVLAMTADGKISDIKKSPARFGSPSDKMHLEKQISLVDGVLFGAGTLRAYGTTLPLSTPKLLQSRSQQQKPLQPIHIAVSASGKLDPRWRFFRQPVPRWLLTTSPGATLWQATHQAGFDRILIADADEKEKSSPLVSIDWIKAFSQLSELGLAKLAILGGGELIASLLSADLIDEFYLTICPLILGGKNAPTPVEGMGLLAHQARHLELLTMERVNQEIFLHYRLKR